MKPGLRRLVLATHVTASVGWLGMALAYVPLCVVTMTTDDPDVLRGLYRVMRVTVWAAVLPASLTSLLTGLALGTWTAWGLLRHYWVATKLVLNLLATGVLLVYTQELAYLGRRANGPTVSAADVDTLTSPDHLEHAIGGSLVLLAAVVLAVYKPWGLTRHGRRLRYARQVAQRSAATSENAR